MITNEIKIAPGCQDWRNEFLFKYGSRVCDSRGCYSLSYVRLLLFADDSVSRHFKVPSCTLSCAVIWITSMEPFPHLIEIRRGIRMLEVC
jgi:hypothetical protein